MSDKTGQCLNAPMSRDEAFAYTAALNHLIAGPNTHIRVGDTIIVFWSRKAEPEYDDFIFAGLTGKTLSQDDLQGYMRHIAHGEPVDMNGVRLSPDEPFYIMGISPNAARLSVRFFYENSFGRFVSNIQRHYDDLEIRRPNYDDDVIVPLRQLSREAGDPHSNNKDVDAATYGALLRAILTGGPYPYSLLEHVEIRLRAGDKLTSTKAAIIKAYYLRQPNAGCPKEVLTVSLNEESNNTAYVLGRLFSVYEQIQEDASPGLNTTIRDKYFSSASASPQSVFPILGRLSEKHRRKLNEGLRVYYSKKVTDLMGRLDAPYPFPARLTLAEQGAFQLGYYQETQKRYEKKNTTTDKDASDGGEE